jgi:hypothetical protein
LETIEMYGLAAVVAAGAWVAAVVAAALLHADNAKTVTVARASNRLFAM